MYAQVEKPKDNKSRAVANSVAQKKSEKRGFGIVDHRPDIVAQRKLQEMVNKRTLPRIIDRMATVTGLSKRQDYNKISTNENTVQRKPGENHNGYNYDNLNDYQKEAFDIVKHTRMAGTGISNSSVAGVTPTLDGKSRLVKVSANPLVASKYGRDSRMTSLVGWVGNIEKGSAYTTKDNGGHMIADSTNGPSIWENLVPQNGPSNKWYDWRKYEKKVFNHLNGTLGPNTPQMEVTITYPDNSTIRPSKFNATYNASDGTKIDSGDVQNPK